MSDTTGAVVFCPGDPTVGIWSATWEISGDFVFDESDDREYVRERLNEAFEGIAGEPVQVTFADEIPEPDDGVTA